MGLFAHNSLLDNTQSFVDQRIQYEVDDFLNIYMYNVRYCTVHISVVIFYTYRYIPVYLKVYLYTTLPVYLFSIQRH